MPFPLISLKTGTQPQRTASYGACTISVLSHVNLGVNCGGDEDHEGNTFRSAGIYEIYACTTGPHTHVVRYMRATNENAYVVSSYGVALAKMETFSYMALHNLQAQNGTYAASLLDPMPSPCGLIRFASIASRMMTLWILAIRAWIFAVSPSRRWPDYASRTPSVRSISNVSMKGT